MGFFCWICHFLPAVIARYKYIPEDHLIIKTDKGSGIASEEYMGIMLLEHSKYEDNGFDDDNDGIIDESKFNGPGEYIEGKAEIDAYLASNYNMNRFSQVHIDLEEFQLTETNVGGQETKI